MSSSGNGTFGDWTTSAVELREVRAFLTLAEELHFARTAERLRIDRSRVSQLITVLETKIGGRLFDRTSRRVRLTPVGEQLRNDLAGTYHELQEALTRARHATIGVTGTLRIGLYVLSNTGPHMTEILRTFHLRHPGCEVGFVDTGIERSYLDQLRRGEVDMLIIRLPLTAADLTIGPVLAREERVAIVARSDQLASRDSISYEDLADRVLSDSPVVPRETMDAFVPPRTPSGRVLKRIANRSFDEMMLNVALGIQVHPTVRSFMDHQRHPGVTSVPIRDLPPSETALAWLTANRTATIDAFARAAADTLAGTELAPRREFPSSDVVARAEA